MKLRFPLADVKMEIAIDRREVTDPLFRDTFYCLAQHEFSMNVPGVAWFYASGGDFISILPEPGANKSSIELYLNGSVYGAILHQRKIMPLHGSCFSYKGKGVMICGDQGAGKSSLTASFCIDGATFLTDDVTPLLFKNGEPYIWAVSDRIKLWSDTLNQLAQREDGLHRVDPEMEKFYYPMTSFDGDIIMLDRIYIIEINDADTVVFDELTGPAKFTALRCEIYRIILPIFKTTG